MTIAFACPDCRHGIEVPDLLAGARASCPFCQAPLDVPRVGRNDASLAAAAAPTAVGPQYQKGERPKERETAPAPASALSLEVETARADAKRVLGPFVLLSELGKGGMGVVYRAWDERLRRIVALKTILTHGDPATVQETKRFQREAEAVARLRHPGIVSVFEAGEVAGTHYLALELVAGETLERRLRPATVPADDTVPAAGPRARIPLNKALEALRDAARAVHYAHEQGVIHRDLKPANIMLDRDDRPHVLDFGLAHVRDAASKLTKTGSRMGTLAYMSPEQATGREIDARTDVYSLGATLYDVLTNRPPFLGENELALLTALAALEPEPPGALNARARGDLETITLKCLEKEPSRRYRTAADLALDLDRYLAGEPISVRPIGTIARLARRARRNKLVTALVFLLLASLPAGTVFLVHERARAKEEREQIARREHDALVSQAAREADAAARAFDAARAAPRASSPGRDDTARRDALLALALEVYEARKRVASLSPDSREARLQELEAALALGDVALDSEQWSVAELAYRKAKDLGIADARASSALERARTARTRVAEEHRKTVERVIDSALAGKLSEPASYEDALFLLVSLREPQTVELLGSSLDAVSRKLGTAALPTRGELAAARLACETLGRIGTRETAQKPLARYLHAERDEIRAAYAAIALCRLGGPEAEDVVNEAHKRFGISGPFWGQVVPYFKPALPDAKVEPRTARAFAARAAVRNDRGDYDGAIADYTSAIALEPGATTYYNNRGVARSAKQDYAGGIADFTRAIEADPKDALAWVNRAFTRNRTRDWQGGLADATRAIELEPSGARAWCIRGMSRAAMDDFSPAIADFDRSIALDPRTASVWTNRGAARANVGDLEGAIGDFSRAIELDPRDAHAFMNRADVRKKRRELDAAISDYTRALELDSEKRGALWGRAAARQEKGDLDGAIADATRAVELEPRNAAIWGDLGAFRAMKGDFPGAVSDMDRALELDPRLTLTLFNRAHAKEKKGDARGSRVDYEKYLELAPQGEKAQEARAAVERLKDR